MLLGEFKYQGPATHRREEFKALVVLRLSIWGIAEAAGWPAEWPCSTWRHINMAVKDKCPDTSCIIQCKGSCSCVSCFASRSKYKEHKKQLCEAKYQQTETIHQHKQMKCTTHHAVGIDPPQ
jgi:hypothetical protein